MAYGDCKYLPRITASDKGLHNKGFNITINPKYDGYLRRLASMVYSFFDKNSSGGGIKNEVIPNQRLAVIKHFDFCYALLIFILKMCGLFL